MIKILQISNKLPFPPKDGGAFAVLNMAKGLECAGAEVSLLAFNTSKHYQDMASVDVESLPYVHIWTVDLDNSISVVSAVSHLLLSKEPHHVSRFRSIAFFDRLSSVLSEYQFDVIQLESLYLIQYLPFIKKLTNAPVVYRAHNIEHEIWMRKAQNERNVITAYVLKRIASRICQYEISIINLFDALIAISSKDLIFFKENALTKPFHIAAVGLDQAHQVNSVPELDLFYIGALDWMPNQEGLLWFIEHCWPSIVTDFPELKFHVAGRNSPPWLEKRLSHAKNIIFHGEVSDSGEYISRHSILLVPLFSGSGMRVKIAEGLNWGKPIITTPIGIEGLDEAVLHDAVFIAADAHGWIEAIKRLLISSDLRDRTASNARDFAVRYLDMKVISKDLLEFYNKIEYE